MGARLDYTCPTCGLSGQVSGGADCGMFSNHTTTIYCPTCDDLQDVGIGIPPFDSSGSPLEPSCGKSKAHPVRLWNRKDPCPRCGEAHLEMDEDRNYTLWD